ncbi:MAG: slipin family protein [Firmicutes bacterium]|nr:slipin family protein [Bacillota bacterium]
MFLGEFWKGLKKHDFVVVDTREPVIDPELYPLLSNPKLVNCFKYSDVAAYEQGLLFFNNKFQKILEPGIYYFWNGMVNVTVTKVDLRQQQIDMTGQEIMTEDKITLRMNFICQYKIVDPNKVNEIKDHEEQLYILLQLVLREYIGTVKLDELLAKKQEIGEFVLARLQERSADFGVNFLNAGVKDIILPGEIKDILNTAKLMDENQTLYRLKELEFLEKICEKIGTISLTGGGGLLEHLNALLANRKEVK